MNTDKDTTQQGSLSATKGAPQQTGQKNEAEILSAKRKYWIEWQCVMDRFPSKERLDKLEGDMIRYISKYLDELYKKKKPSYSSTIEENHEAGSKYDDDDVLNDIRQEIKDFFPPKDKKSKKKTLIEFEHAVTPMESEKGEILEFRKQENEVWTEISQDDYIKCVRENEGSNANEKHSLRYTVYTQKWMRIFNADWEHVSDSHLVFSFRGWFLTKNNLRLTDASGENRGSMNPPDPPPPPK